MVPRGVRSRGHAFLLSRPDKARCRRCTQVALTDQEVSSPCFPSRTCRRGAMPMPGRGAPAARVPTPAVGAPVGTGEGGVVCRDVRIEHAARPSSVSTAGHDGRGVWGRVPPRRSRADGRPPSLLFAWRESVRPLSSPLPAGLGLGTRVTRSGPPSLALWGSTVWLVYPALLVPVRPPEAATSGSHGLTGTPACVTSSFPSGPPAAAAERAHGDAAPTPDNPA